MNSTTRSWRVLVGGVAAGSAALFGFAGTVASAEPEVPAPAPAPATATVTVTVTPQAASDAEAAAAAPATVTATATAAPATSAAAAPASAPRIPATSGTLVEYFTDKGVALEPQKAEGFTALNIVLPMPTGWTVVPDPNVPDAFTVIADRLGGDALYTPNAQLVVYKLAGEFDPEEAITHGYVDSQKLFAWQSTAASMANFGGFPSAIIEGTYRDNDVTLNTSRRHVIAKSGSDHYLVSLFVTTSANQVVATAEATDAIVNGFRVTAPGTAVGAAPSAAAAPLVQAGAPIFPAIPMPAIG
ncbi:MAG: hypothetical protein E6Q56_08955 [Mycobacterium sp.]|nr:MAG: hypothetical protein E6Q56_08955 [Mycobacterium sp.]